MYAYYMPFALQCQLDRRKLLENSKQVPAYLSQAPASVFQKLSYEYTPQKALVCYTITFHIVRPEEWSPDSDDRIAISPFSLL